MIICYGVNYRLQCESKVLLRPVKVLMDKETQDTILVNKNTLVTITTVPISPKWDLLGQLKILKCKDPLSDNLF